MLTLYYKPTCPYCQAVLGEAESLNVHFTLKDVSFDQVLKDELIAQGGKLLVPFLVDSERGVKMYESQDIIAYLQEHYREGSNQQNFGGLKIHQSEEICDTCQ